MKTFRLASAVLSCAVLSLALTGCDFTTHDSSVIPSGTTSPVAEAPTATTTPSPVAKPAAVTIPNECPRLVDASTYTATFGTIPLNDPAVVNPGEAGAVTPTTPPAGASVDAILKSAIQLRCVWRDPGADITYLEASVATVDPKVAGQYLDSLTAKGYTCAQANGGRQCQLVTLNTQYPVDDAHTAFLRDSVYVAVDQSNFATKNLMGSIAATLWD